MTSKIVVTNLSKYVSQKLNFGDIDDDKVTQRSHCILQNINLNIKPGLFVTLFGPNGCGKTTLLNIIAGLNKPSSGTVTIDSKHVDKSKIGYVFQNYYESLLPWLTVYKNLLLPLEIQNIEKDKRNQIVNKYLHLIGLENYKNKYPYELSGGLKQLLAIARTFVYDPDILLMDEPFSSLDYQLTSKMHFELLKLWEYTKKTILFVSHQIDEAIYLADEVVILTNKPTQIANIIQVKLPRPRKPEMLVSSEFNMLRGEVLKFFNL